MDQFSTEEEQIEAIKKFWKENGMPIIIGAVLGLGGLWGWRYYNEAQLMAQGEASDAYNVAIEKLTPESPDKAAVQQFIDGNQDTTYAALAALRLAKAAVESGELPEAEKQLQWIVDSVSDQTIKDLALVRLARVQSELQKYDAAQSSLAKITSESFKAEMFSVKGDVLVKLEKFKEAQDSYNQALELSEGNQSTLQMKIDHLNAKVSS